MLLCRDVTLAADAAVDVCSALSGQSVEAKLKKKVFSCEDRKDIRS